MIWVEVDRAQWRKVHGLVIPIFIVIFKFAFNFMNSLAKLSARFDNELVTYATRSIIYFLRNNFCKLFSIFNNSFN